MTDDDAPLSAEERKLQRFLDDLAQRTEDTIAHSEEIRAKWHAALENRDAWCDARPQEVVDDDIALALRAFHKMRAEQEALRNASKCPVCEGMGLMRSQLERGPSDRFPGSTLIETCKCCTGSGAVQIVPERRGIA